ncbi:MAG: DUF4491 family protein [Chloroflexi bacterium]|nr:DUF4491 family protein [Chloroflexota bacterium]
MNLNWIGPVSAAATFFSIWLGHVGVRKIEAASPTIWLPAAGALALGLALEVGALLSDSLHLSGALGIVGITLLWDALEFSRQHKRVKHGHAPANPANPRHARLLAESPATTTADWLKREPLGRKEHEQ